jgi:TRAP-type C4-dicarboxylate transport system permease small subunit
MNQEIQPTDDKEPPAQYAARVVTEQPEMLHDEKQIIDAATPRFYRSIARVIAIVSEIMGVVAVVVLVFMMMLTVTDVCLRYFFDNPIMASMELTCYMMVVVGFLGMAWCALKGMHIKVDLIVGRWSEKSQAIMNIINAVLVIGVCSLIASQSYFEGFAARDMHKASEITGIVQHPFYWLIVFSYALLLFAMLNILVQNIAKVVKK